MRSFLLPIFSSIALIAFVPMETMAQQTFNQVAGSGGDQSNIGGAKDGGCSFADYDRDGDLDLLVNTNQNAFATRSYLLRNDNGIYIDVTTAVASGLKSSLTERSASWGDCNNDGYPDILVNSNGRVKILRNDGGTVFTTIFDITSMTDGMNTEGAGWLDYDNDGDLDFFVECHNFGIDLFNNNGATPTPTFTQVTINGVGAPGTGAGGLGLPEGGASTGDYACSTDLNADGYVDIIARRENSGTNNGLDQNPYDIFFNQGNGTFAPLTTFNEAADNGNKGGIASADFDNDGDFDLLWTSASSDGNRAVLYQQNGLNSGTFTLVPNPFRLDNNSVETSTDFDGCAVGDIDNDGDLDVFMTQNSGTSKLFLNQTSGAGSFSFRQPGPTWISGAAINYGINITGDGEGCVFVDFDNDGDLDLYVIKNGATNHALRNNYIGSAAEIAATFQNSYLRVIPEIDQGGGVYSPAVNATVRLLDCDGNSIGGIREVSGGDGHGTQQSPWLHFGLKFGPDISYLIEVQFTRDGMTPQIVRKAVVPSLLGTSVNSSTLDQEQTIVIRNTDSSDEYLCVDTDNDGVFDYLDLDDDNDGLLDSEEIDCSSSFISSNSGGYALNTDFSGASPLSGMFAYNGNEVDFSYTLQGTATWASGIRVENNGALAPDGDYINVQPRNTDLLVGDVAIYTLDFLEPVTDLEFKWAGLDNGDMTRFEAFYLGNEVTITQSNITNLNIPAANLSFYDNNTIESINGAGNAPDNAVQFSSSRPIDRIVLTAGKNSTSSNTVTMQLYEMRYCILTDTDGDGIVDSEDTDSDNDGCNDVIEAGFTDADDDGEMDGTGYNADGTVSGSDGYTGTDPRVTDFSLVALSCDTDSDGINPLVDLDDDNDGISDIQEQDCTTPTPTGLGTPTIIQGGLAVDRIYTDFSGYWVSGTPVSPILPNLSHNLLAFRAGGVTYTTGVSDDNVLDTDGDGYFDQIDTDGNGTGDVAAIGSRWQAFYPSTTISNKTTLEASLNDGNATNALGLTIIGDASVDPLNPLLTNGVRGLDLGTGVANVGGSWFYNVSALDASSVGDGIPDLLLTQVADPGGVNHTVTFFDNSGSVVGNAVQVSAVSGPLQQFIARYRLDVYNANGSSNSANTSRDIRMAALELSEFGINAGNIGDIDIMRLTLTANADVAFVAYNTTSFAGLCADIDSDMDGVPDSRDLDSDNDGIFDVIEGGCSSLDTNGDGRIDSSDTGYSDLDVDGMDDDSALISPTDSDGDGIIDAIELDSDNDGCFDVIEAGYTDQDGDGLLGE